MRKIPWVFSALLLAASLARGADRPAAGHASGTLSVSGKSFALSRAAAFVDQKDERKPVILVLSEAELPAASWKSESDYSMYCHDHPLKGVAFWLDRNREVFRTEYNDGGPFPTSASGIFELKLDPGSGKELSGSAVSTAVAAKLHDAVRLDAKFRAAVK